MSRYRRVQRFGTIGLALCGSMACSTSQEPEYSWEEFQQRAARVVDGRTIYIVEWDRPVTLDQLRAYYDTNVVNRGTATVSQESTVNVFNGQDDVWRGDDGLRLTYCVSNDFGTDKARAVNEMHAATRAWEDVGHVNFRYVPSQDATCSNTNTSIGFAVRPWNSGGACAFFPSGDACVARTVVIDFDDLDTNPFFANNAPNVETVGVFRHELGHVLGLRHEHTRPDAGLGCFEDNSWRAVTDYDQSSVMHYPWCNGVSTSDLSITAVDRLGIERLYPFNFSSLRDPDEKFDLNADGRADVCGRGSAGVYCALSNGAGFGPVTLWQSTLSDVSGWNHPQYFSTIRFPDLNGDHRADICGRGAAGIHCALGTGSGFGPLTLWATSYSDVNNWNLAEYYSTIRFPDLNGDGRADVCGRGSGGINCALSNGSGFGAVSLWSTNFRDSFGWNAGPEYYSTIRFPDLNGDGRADVCGRGSGGINCGLSNGAIFAATSLWITSFSDVNNWHTSPGYYSTIRFPDVNGDGRADVCGRGSAGLHCAMSLGGSFGALSLQVTNFSDAGSWDRPQYYSTIQFADLNGDHRADVCARGVAGMHCALSAGASYGALTLWIANYSDPAGWNAGPFYYSTIRLADVTGDGRADVCGRGSGGINCAPSTGGIFTPFTLWTSSFRDIDGWKAPEYYSTIRFP
jgi:hypothetical protein